MQARHPKTGAPIRILQSEGSIWRDQKTLAWLDDIPTEPELWKRYDIGVTSVKAYTMLKKEGIDPSVFICLDQSDTALEWFKKYAANSPAIVAVSKAFIEAVGIDTLISLRVRNMICLDEMKDLYPYTGGAWDGTVEDAKVLLALMLHTGRTFPVAPTTRPTYGLKCESALVPPQRLWLIQQYYEPQKDRRAKEIKHCLDMNIRCPLVDKIVLLNEKPYRLPSSNKIQEVVIGDRLTYAGVIKWIYENVPQDIIVVFSNSDIYLDETLRSVWSTSLEDKFLALLRWDVTEVSQPTIFGPRADSQDTWIISSTAVKSRTWDYKSLDFPFGKMGCDNAITVEMTRQKFLVANPALTIKTYHVHASGVRNYDPKDIVDKKILMYIQPTGLHDMRPVINIPTDQVLSTLKTAPFSRQLKGPSSTMQMKTVCSMVSRNSENKTNLLYDGLNTVDQQTIPIYSYRDVFQTREGLVYSYDSILVGKTKAAAAAWSGSQVSTASASLLTERCFAAPLSDEVAANAADYALKYLGKIFYMRSLVPDEKGEFWCSKNKECVETLKLFEWPNRDVPVLSRDENRQVWAKKAIVWNACDNPTVTSEEIRALRDALGDKWVSKHEGREKRIVILADDAWINAKATMQYEEALQSPFKIVVLFPNSSITHVVEKMLGAWAVLCVKGSAAAKWCWAMPEGAYLWEIQSEMDPSVDILDLCGAAKLRHRFVIVAKGVPNDTARTVMVQRITLSMEDELVSIRDISAKPQIVMPAPTTGFFSHAGDSFREMVDIWAERGYCTIKRESVAQVWLGGVGETLLYDRPTLDWLKAAPAAELTWKRALFGNPVPLKGEKAWTFWPRRPRLVEELAPLGSTPFAERSQTLVFYGRSENAVQKGNRVKEDWSTACSEFVHIDGEKKYPYTHEEYLKRLAGAKFGLCLAGFGKKCHREIECMAMGCVPVVAPEVDMTYADPPEEGVHYFRVSSAAEAKKIAETPEERWVAMSAACRAWWQRNASAEGAWKLTESLAVS